MSAYRCFHCNKIVGENEEHRHPQHMTPDQIFKAEAKLRELKKIETALSSFTEFVFGVDLQTVKGPAPDFPISNSDLSILLKEATEKQLKDRVATIRAHLSSVGVVL